MTIDKQGLYALLQKPPEERTVEIFGNVFHLRAMTEADGVEYELTLQTSGKYDVKRARRLMLAMCLVDANGNRIVEKEEDLQTLPRGIAGALYEVCLEMNNYSRSEIKQLSKNSGPAAA